MSLFKFDPNSEHIRLAHKRLGDAYARKEEAEVPVTDLSPLCSPVPNSVEDMMTDHEKMLENALVWANALAEAESDWPPFLRTCVFTLPIVPDAFGCPITYSGGCAWTKPVITDINQVWSLKPVSIREASIIKHIREWIDFAQRKAGTEVPFWTMDIQSPFNVAAHIIDAMDLMTACITDPDAVHHLLGMVTDYTIEMMQDHIAQMENPAFPGICFPGTTETTGVVVADDTPLIMLNPEMYKEFGSPYIARLGEAFGAIHIHCCGDYRHNLDNLLDIPTVRSIQLHAGDGEFPIPKTPDEDAPFNRARKQIAYYVDCTPTTLGIDMTDLDWFSEEVQKHYIDYVLPRLCNTDMTGAIIQSPGFNPGAESSREYVRWTREEIDRLRGRY